MDISTLSAVETYDVSVIHPATGLPVPGDGGDCSVTVYGPGTKPFVAAKSKASAKVMERIRKRGKIDPTDEEEVAEAAKFLTAITKSFNHFGYKNMAQGEEMHRALYSDITLGWIADLVNKEAGDWANFMPASANS